jgi:hypothetical protein
MPRKFLLFVLLTLGILLQASPARLLALDLGPDGLNSISLPTGIVLLPPVTQADLDGNRTSETLVLTDGRLSIFSGGETVWQSPQAWQIVQAAISDLNRDGQPEVAILLWRPFHPWPVDQWLPNGGRITNFHNAEGLSCHIILIGWMRGSYHELWAGSAMADPITSFAAADLDGNHAQELVALEGRYTGPRSAPARKLKVWEWNGFGFSVVSSIDGIFDQMTLVQLNNDHILILVP